MASYNLENIVETMESWGLTDVMLPFLLIFTIIFAILQKANIFGVDKKRFNVITGLVISLLVVIPHVTGNYPGGYDVVEIINASLPSIALLVVAIIMVLLLIGIFGGESAWSGPVTGWVVIVAAIAVLWIFGGSIWGWSGWDKFVGFFGEEIVILIIILLVFGIIIALITSEGNEAKANIVTSIGDGIGRLFGKK